MAGGDIGNLQAMPDLEYVHLLIFDLYQSGDNNKGQIASKKLEQIQNSFYGWKIADQLLIKAKDFESCYFAAQTLKTKILHSFSELPKESYASLKDSLINHIVKIDNKVVLTQLCLSLSYVCKFFFY